MRTPKVLVVEGLRERLSGGARLGGLHARLWALEYRVLVRGTAAAVWTLELATPGAGNRTDCFAIFTAPSKPRLTLDLIVPLYP
jgi:hypothetical protein